MKKFKKVDLKEVWVIFSTSSKKRQTLVALLMALIISLSIIAFDIYAPVVWIAMFLLLTSYEDILLQFIAINYQFLTPLTTNRCRMPNRIHELLNDFILKDIRFRHPDIIFKVNNNNERSAMKTFITDGVYNIEIDALALKVYSQAEFQAVIYHELGHVYLKHNNEFKLLFFIGYFVFIFLPIALPLFWIIGSYLSRRHELAANEYSLRHDPSHYMLKAIEGAKAEQNVVGPWKNLWHRLLFITVAPNPSTARQIKALRRVRL